MAAMMPVELGPQNKLQILLLYYKGLNLMRMECRVGVRSWLSQK